MITPNSGRGSYDRNEIRSLEFDVITGAYIAGPKIAFLRLRIKDQLTYNVVPEGDHITVNI
jgi:hypothetical protein